MGTAKNLRWLGPVLDCSGYASAARGYLRACEVSGINLQVRDRSRSLNLREKGVDQPILDLYKRLYNVPVPEDAPTVQHQVPDTFFRDSRTKFSIGYTIFEMTGIPRYWVPFCNSMQAIWTGSEYSKAAFLASGVTTPIHVLPHAIDTDFYSPLVKPWEIKNRRSFAFLSIFDFTDRKAWKDLLRAYWSAFSSSDDVCLILKVYYGDFSEASRADIIRRIAMYRAELKVEDCAPLLIYGHDVKNSDMPGLYRSADCYVGISREGFGLPYAEAMACGLPCIGPEVGGTRQFMNPENSFLVKYVGDEHVSPEMLSNNPMFDGLKWAKHSFEHLAEVMKRVVENSSERNAVAQRGTDFIRKELTFRQIGDRIASLVPE